MITHNVLALDVGERRIGLAIAKKESGIARPFEFIDNNENIMTKLQSIIKDQSIDKIVVGLPRNLDGLDTKQTKSVRDFADKLQTELRVQVEFMDEALTSQKAEEELKARNRSYSKGDIDALAACYILEDFINA